MLKRFQTIAAAIFLVIFTMLTNVAPASADINYSAPNGGFVATGWNVGVYPESGIEIGIVHKDIPTNKKYITCNNQFGNPDVGTEWKSLCQAETLKASTKQSVQGYYKQTNPDGTIKWECISPNYIPTPGGLRIDWTTSLPSPQVVATTTLAGSNLTFLGRVPCTPYSSN